MCQWFRKMVKGLQFELWCARSWTRSHAVFSIGPKEIATSTALGSLSKTDVNNRVYWWQWYKNIKRNYHYSCCWGTSVWLVSFCGLVWFDRVSSALTSQFFSDCLAMSLGFACIKRLAILKHTSQSTHPNWCDGHRIGKFLDRRCSCESAILVHCHRWNATDVSWNILNIRRPSTICSEFSTFYGKNE